MTDEITRDDDEVRADVTSTEVPDDLLAEGVLESLDGLDPELIAVLQILGYSEPTPIQRHAIPHILDARDVVGLVAVAHAHRRRHDAAHQSLPAGVG